MSHPQQARVITTYTRSREDPITCKAGDTLAVGDRYDWNGSIWVWCTNQAGKSGWMPEDYVRIDDERGTARVHYNAIELTVAVGDVLTVIEQSHEWAWCETAEGQQGWVPLENIEMV